MLQFWGMLLNHKLLIISNTADDFLCIDWLYCSVFERESAKKAELKAYPRCFHEKCLRFQPSLFTSLLKTYETHTRWRKFLLRKKNPRNLVDMIIIIHYINSHYTCRMDRLWCLDGWHPTNSLIHHRMGGIIWYYHNLNWIRHAYTKGKNNLNINLFHRLQENA